MCWFKTRTPLAFPGTGLMAWAFCAASRSCAWKSWICRQEDGEDQTFRKHIYFQVEVLAPLFQGPALVTLWGSWEGWSQSQSTGRDLLLCLPHWHLIYFLTSVNQQIIVYKRKFWEAGVRGQGSNSYCLSAVIPAPVYTDNSLPTRHISKCQVIMEAGLCSILSKCSSGSMLTRLSVSGWAATPPQCTVSEMCTMYVRFDDSERKVTRSLTNYKTSCGKWA